MLGTKTKSLEKHNLTNHLLLYKGNNPQAKKRQNEHVSSRLTTGVTSVECQKQVRSWRLLRSLMELLIPSCNCAFIEQEREIRYYPPPAFVSKPTTTPFSSSNLQSPQRFWQGKCRAVSSELRWSAPVEIRIKRKPSKGDMDALRLMSSVVVGAGLISGKELDHHDDELMYLRANFQSVGSSAHSESFHLIDPDGNIGQELSIFFYRSR
ncbi:hypothetical protein V6N13_145320 [Hibiscus sabdariffa]|uniref:Protein MIZU-KUSSEI 1-like n=1 Tax=Hibiscus sabdariffa TaxID=183260 RepID=A0ABR2TP88_9ROSI